MGEYYVKLQERKKFSSEENLKDCDKSPFNLQIIVLYTFILI